ncbi:hypothetical protein GTY65_23575 [Streptomyces sp. SID8379]|uniref:lipoprotein n=1 Tax=unclassified Streptomyces TaxID=2593676 RepID=UPI0005B9528A|nr:MULTISPECIES: lipoprotein [unclassified Streptomyces]MYW67027.1 hypothetical protein [Streptomyces sp. SID8379]
MRRKTVATACLCASVLAVGPAFAADGDAADLSARQLADEAKQELLDAQSLHITLANRSDTERSTRTPAAFDLRLDEDGNCAGSLRMGVGGANGGSVDLVKRGDEVWMKPDATFWKTQVGGGAGELASQLFGDRYVHGTTDDPMLAGLADTCDLDAFRGQLDSGSARAAQESLTKGDATQVDGTGVVPLTGSEDGSTITMYVTSDAPHRLVRATEKGDDENITMTLTDYDTPVPDKTPSADESVDISKLHDVDPDATPPQA